MTSENCGHFGRDHVQIEERGNDVALRPPPVDPIILREQPLAAKRPQCGVAHESSRPAHMIARIVAAWPASLTGGTQAPLCLGHAQPAAALPPRPGKVALPDVA